MLSNITPLTLPMQYFGVLEKLANKIISIVQGKLASL